MLGGKGNSGIGRQLKIMNKRISNAIKHGNWKEVGKAMVYFQKNTKTLTKTFKREALKDALKDYIPANLIDKATDKIFTGVQECL